MLSKIRPKFSSSLLIQLFVFEQDMIDKKCSYYVRMINRREMRGVL